MKRLMVAALVFCMAVPALFAAVPADVAAPIRRALDGFNAGDIKAFLATYAAGEITIVNESAPHRWTGLHAAKE